MKFIFPFLGKTRESYLDEGIKDYIKRLSRYVQVETIDLKTSSPKNIPESVFKQHEAKLLLNKISTPSLTVALDNRGSEIDSPGLARLITEWEERGQHTIYFLIGGHLGLHDNIVTKADKVLSLSKLTFTHEMCRLVLLEQLYRACTIKAGHNYHN